MLISASTLTLSGGAGLIAYVVAWIAIPEETEHQPMAIRGRREGHYVAALVFGAGLVALGVLLAARIFIPWFSAALFWPLAVVALGILIIVTAVRR